MWGNVKGAFFTNYFGFLVEDPLEWLKLDSMNIHQVMVATVNVVQGINLPEGFQVFNLAVR